MEYYEYNENDFERVAEGSYDSNCIDEYTHDRLQVGELFIKTADRHWFTAETIKEKKIKLYQCEKCNKIYLSDYGFKKIDNEEFCPECVNKALRNNELFKCSNCGKLHTHKENLMKSLFSDSIYCKDNDSCLQRAYFGNYSFKPTPKFYYGKNEEKGKNALVTGFELEVERVKTDKQIWQICKILHEEINEKYFNGALFIYFKHDGSLNDGIEVVSQPFTEQFMRENIHIFEEMLKLLKDNGCLSHDTKTCGLHVHINKKYLKNEENVNKMICFTEYYKEKVQIFSRRSNYNYCHFFSDETTSNKLKSCNIEYIDKYKGNVGRYQVVNTKNSNTIEIRVFRGTLKSETFFASLEFCYNLAKLVVTEPLTRMSWSKVANYPTSKYIRAYCKEMNIPLDRKYMLDYSLDAIKELNKIKSQMRLKQQEILKILYDYYIKIDKLNITLKSKEIDKIIKGKNLKEKAEKLKKTNISNLLAKNYALELIVRAFNNTYDCYGFSSTVYSLCKNLPKDIIEMAKLDNIKELTTFSSDLYNLADEFANNGGEW